MACTYKKCGQKLSEYKIYARDDDRPYCSPICLFKDNPEKNVIYLKGTSFTGNIEDLLEDY